MSGLRYSFTFAPDGRWAAALTRYGGRLEIECWRPGPDGWKAIRTGIRADLEDQLLPLRDTSLLVRTALGRQQVLVATQPGESAAVDGRDLPAGGARARARARRIARLPVPGARLIPPAPGDKRTLAVVVTFDGHVSRLFRLLPSDELQPVPPSLPGLTSGGVWLDADGRRLVLTQRPAPGQARAVLLDTSDGSVCSLFSIGPRTEDRAELYSPRSTVLVVRTSAGEAERIGFARLGASAEFWFPERTCAEGGIDPLQLDPSGELLLLHEQRGTRSELAIYDIGRDERAPLAMPAGCLRGPAAWTEDGIVLPWSAPATPHATLLVRPGHPAPLLQPVAAGRSARIVRVAGAAGTLQALVYGDDGWQRAERLVIALHGGPVAAWRFEFEPLFQHLAAAGIVVMALNQRGSAGYGLDYIQAIRGAWGGPDLDDVTAVIRGLARIRGSLPAPAVLGVSYGAYLALLAACTAPRAISRCVAVAPFLSPARLDACAGQDVRALISRLDGLHELDDRIGSRDVLGLCGGMSAPCLILHGADDDVIPVSQSRDLARQLTALGRRPGTHFRYVEIAHGRHDLLGGAGAEELFDRITAFVTGGDPDLWRNPSATPGAVGGGELNDQPERQRPAGAAGDRHERYAR